MSATAGLPLTRLGLLAGAGLLWATAAVAGPDDALENKVKAAYLYHLTKFVSWPAPAGEQLRLCVQGDSQLGALRAELSNRQVNNRPLLIDPEHSGDPAQCQLLFLGSAVRQPADVLARVRSLPVLTVGDSEGFAQRGGVIGFYAESGRIRLEINPEAARSANLKISAKLFELARTVR